MDVVGGSAALDGVGAAQPACPPGAVAWWLAQFAQA
jgi:hypothetical protein